MKRIQFIIHKLFSTSAAGLYMIAFAFAIGLATFIENDFGTSSAQKLIFKSWWFELLLVLFGGSILVNVFRFRLISQRKWAVLAFHVAIIVILIGAAVTRYTGYEGMMHIREGSSSHTILSFEEYLVFEGVEGENKFAFTEPVLFATLGNNHLERSYLLGNREVTVEVTDFMPNPTESMIPHEKGLPTVKIVIGGANGREEYYLEQGRRKRIRSTVFNFTEQEDPQSFNIKEVDGRLFFKAPTSFTQTIMAAQITDTLAPGQFHPLQLRSLYASGQQRFVFGDFLPKAKVKLASSGRKMNSNSIAGIQVRVRSENEEVEQYVFGSKGIEGRPKVFQLGDLQLAISYGAKKIELPFSLQLRDFILEKYPGTNSASSYASEVTLIDQRSNLREDTRIYMNNVLDYEGYRFFQSSFDQDELGTWLSVNHDWWGTWISYLGYAILTLGMILTFFHKESRFQQLARNLKRLREQGKVLTTACMGCLMMMSTPLLANPRVATPSSIGKDHATKFGLVILQDHRGRMKPMNTYASEIVRKLSRKESLHGLTAEQIVLGMASQPKNWYHIPLIKIGKHDRTRAILPEPAAGKLLSYGDFFHKDGSYKLRDHVRAAYNTPKKDRGVFEKEMMKLDEKVNICSMVFSGGFMRVFPIPGDANNTWEAPSGNSSHHGHGQIAKTYAKEFYDVYISALQTALTDHNWEPANQLLAQLEQYQVEYGKQAMPSKQQKNAELLLNDLMVFRRLAKYYGLLGLLFLTLLFTSVFKPRWNLKVPTIAAQTLFLGCFLFHGLGLGLRWYVSGRAPWSNGYESMIYIAFTTVLAGLFFSRKSLGAMTATNVLASTILLVAGLSWLDPEITPLVPVLRSYWLTIHVSLEAGSYGFLMLGALIGVLNLIFIIFRNQKNAVNVNRIINEMTQISEMTLIGGLFMISVGTYLGGVWANESWGRYWGWDAKETWALVTILIYAFILHMRFIPGMRGAYAFNVASLFGWASVIMTYFGVNYYLSGLHSYAAGDPVPIPAFVYYAVGILTVIGVVAFWKDWRYRRTLATEHH